MKPLVKKDIKSQLNHIVSFGPSKNLPSNRDKKLRELVNVVEELTKRVERLMRRF